ncbi:MAG: bifunctional homocysteine S-methyltransferase/methylenetetrahydrofolate reductase [bacterium]
MKSFLEALQEAPLVFDGAMGTQLYERGIFINKSFDDANLSHPELVQAIHADYVDAGADVITTNTFAANRIKLKRHGLESKVVEINRNGVELARQVAQGRCYVAGSMGPTSLTPTMMTDAELREIRDAFAQQAQILAEAGVDVIILETFRLLSEIRLAIEAIKSVCDLPIIAQMAFDSDHRTGDGADPERVARLLIDWGADVIGANCLEGPHVVFDVVEKMVGLGVPVSAMPNAGYPRKVDERLIYMATPEYFGVYARRYLKAGVRVVGGCCGTGPDHISRVVDSARMMGGGRVSRASTRLSIVDIADSAGMPEVPLTERSGLAKKLWRVWEDRVKGGGTDAGRRLHRDNFVVSVEVNPPAGLDPRKAVDAARMLREGGVDVINIADGPRASVRMANWALATQLQRELDTEIILHVCGRDRNLLGLQSDILAYHALDLHNLVIVTGDPPKVGDYPHATAVFDLDSIGMLRMVQNFNRGVDPAGREIGNTTQFFCACGVEPAAADYERELRRLDEKVAAGAKFIMTQPVYDPRVLEKFLDDTQHLDVPVLVGLLPLASYRNAEFLHNEVPGMSVPDDIRERMQKAGSGPEARREGVRIAQETLQAVAHRVVGAYIMPPLGRYAAALEILECIEGYATPAPEEALR